jgi:hypothetical protein
MKYLFLVSILFFISCSKSEVKKEHEIVKFDNIIKDTLVPKKNQSYTTQFVSIKGFANDSIMIKFGENGTPLYFKGKINEFINPDYYGNRDAIFIFNPYKAKNGKLNIIFCIK